MTRAIGRAGLWLAMTLLCAGPSSAAGGPSDAACEDCHEVETARTHAGAGERARAPHAKVACIDCHTALRGFDPEAGEDHATPLDAPVCSACHAEVEALVAESEHAGDCGQCHEAHAVGLVPAAGAPAGTAAAGACGKCHETSVEEWSRSVHLRDPGNGRVAAGCVDCHGSHDVHAAADRRSTVHPLNLPDTCESCHRPAPSPAHPAPAGDTVAHYETSVHGEGLRKGGLVVSATCASCHGAHEIRAADDPAAPTSRRQIPATCGACHVGVLETYLEGVHGAAFRGGGDDVPVCTDCHREHAVRDPAMAGSSVSAALVAGTCARCHADDELANRYGFAATAWISWGRSYHGIASGYGAADAANCASCHGFHDIFPSTDPRSRVHPSNLDATCGGCHAAAGKTFARIPVHSLVDRASNFVPWLVRQVYAALIFGLIGAFSVFVVVDLFGRLRLRLGWGPPETEHVDATAWRDEDLLVAPAETFRRMGYQARLQHAVLIVSFLLLVATGLPVFLHDSAGLHALLSIEGGFALRSTLHRAGAIVLIGLSLWHLAILAMLPSTRRWFGMMMIRWRDVVDFGNDLAFSLGAIQRRPLLGRYGLVEKLEYGAVLWGNVVMIVTGTILWRPGWFLDWMPVWTFDVCRVIHGFEATLAFLAIIIWHMYHVHLRPDVFPMSRSWITGRISRAEMRRHHPGEYLRLLERRRRERDQGGDGA